MALKDVYRFFPDGDNADGFALNGLSVFGIDVMNRLFDNVAVVSTTKSAVGGNDNNCRAKAFGCPVVDQLVTIIHVSHHIAQHSGKLVGIGPGLLDGHLCFPQFRGGNHLHGLGDLLGIDHRFDPLPDFFKLSTHGKFGLLPVTFCIVC